MVRGGAKPNMESNLTAALDVGVGTIPVGYVCGHPLPI